MLEELPAELALFIFSKIEDRLDLKCLSEVSRRLNRLAIPFLYESILITTAEKANGIVRAHQRAGVLQYTKDIQVGCEGNEEWFDTHNTSERVERCHHSKWKMRTDDDDPSSDNDSGGPDDGVTADDENLTSAELEDKKRWIDTEGKAKFYAVTDFIEFRHRILSILIRCKERTLRSFRWDRKDCIPPEILGEEGYLPTKQNPLETLFIRADGSCKCHSYNPQLFTKLKKLAWDNLGARPPVGEEDLKRLRGCLELVSHQLVYLELGLKRWEYLFHNPNDDDATISQEIIKPSPGPGGKRFQFQNLQHLSLTGLCGEEWPNFLDRLNASETPFCLHTVEIQAWTEYDTESSENEDITRFINRCEPLENLYVALRDQDGALELWQSLLRHRYTLKAFVYYVDPTVSTLEDSTPFYIHDADVSFGKPHSHKTNAEWNPLRDLDLEFLGVSYDFEYLLPVLAPVTKNRCLKVLLIRRDPLLVIDRLKAVEKPKRATDSEDDKSDSDKDEDFQDFDEFVQWAFGPEGFPSLQMIGLGDFTDSIEPREKALLCPKSDPESEEVFPGRNYRFVTRRDWAQQELLRNYAGAMQACPTDLIEEWTL
ncbi:uncharacterized protein GIQ15_02798 [Arthroderma uncinatum]|uniref:uncharacterized protein n=1 Tax=Arthroderma uncinatum TaxID=74035 RepID=UPI00144A93EC|nr:uncharacterized protein GIQ15_02798 [Arthroderma uncinatum]KAF3483474.1 hypothetical protein GIQ15_02798 [Arthroderma uncinatum]